ncbi:hypothetical protein BDF20DRAFT_883922 [Mycotypha africana]|uniref:uncharacterized protein n=1 Tax=Mycotypha africana TaxID=64632 RepID=UPI0023003DDE|nr:uncharacterized protein BDF20DRAFT_883922 [Mycotypha africana]KAI8973756.1 hypothetical protein BDF20DRAFT_883922 [Mycotypha africana]
MYHSQQSITFFFLSDKKKKDHAQKLYPLGNSRNNEKEGCVIKCIEKNHCDFKHVEFIIFAKLFKHVYSILNDVIFFNSRCYSLVSFQIF